MLQRLRWLSVFSLAGRSGRVATALVLFVSGLGRLGSLPSQVLPTTFWTPSIYGVLLVICSMAVLMTTPIRLHWSGRIAAIVSSVLLTGMIWDIGAISVSLLILLLADLILVAESFTSNADY